MASDNEFEDLDIESAGKGSYLGSHEPYYPYPYTIMAIKITLQDVHFYPHHTFPLILCVSQPKFCILRPGLVLDHKAIPPLMILR